MECQQDFHSRLQGMARNTCVPSINRDYLSTKFANELRKARGRELSQKPLNCDRKCANPAKACAQVLKSNLPATSDNSSCEQRKPSCRTLSASPCSARGCGDRRAEEREPCRTTEDSSKRDECAKTLASTLRKARADPCDSGKQTSSLQDLEEKVDVLNCQAQQLLKQLKREQVERERMAELYDDALEEIRRLRERERQPNPDGEARVRRLECERDEAVAKMRSAQVDSEEVKCKLDRVTEDNNRERQRLLDKIACLEHRIHATEAEHDDLSRRHNRSLETIAKVEAQADEQKTKILVLEDQKQELVKQVDNLGLFVKDLEESGKQLHARLDEKRYEVHQAREKVTELEEVLARVDQHLLHEKEYFLQLQNDAYQAQQRGQELRTEMRNIVKKKTRDCKA